MKTRLGETTPGSISGLFWGALAFLGTLLAWIWIWIDLVLDLPPELRLVAWGTAYVRLPTQCRKRSRQLATLGTEKGSIKVGALRINTATSDMHRQMQQRMRGGFSIEASTEEQPDGMSEMVMVQQHIIADWPLPGDEIELLVTSHKLRQEIKEAGFNSSDDEESALSAEEQELVEEAEMFGESGEENSDEPVIAFVATITQQERAVLMKKAIADARHAAEMIAEASGTQLGKLVQIRESGDESTGMDEYELMEQFGRQNASTILAAMQSRDQATLTTIGTEPTELSFSVSMTIGFDIGDE
jgi:hypothetical protein